MTVFWQNSVRYLTVFWNFWDQHWIWVPKNWFIQRQLTDNEKNVQKKWQIERTSLGRPCEISDWWMPSASPQSCCLDTRQRDRHKQTGKKVNSKRDWDLVFVAVDGLEKNFLQVWWPLFRGKLKLRNKQFGCRIHVKASPSENIEIFVESPMWTNTMGNLVLEKPS